MHKLESHILSLLTLSSRLRYSQLKPQNVEGNHFMYYLKKLIATGLVTKSDQHYMLTPQGQAHIDKLSLTNFQPRIQPKIVTLIVCQNSAGDYLLYRRKRQPFMGKVGFPYGKIHLGESLLAAANRELLEKTGITAQLTHRGDAYLAIYNGTELISHMLCHIFTGSHPSGNLITKSKIGDCLWGKLTDFPPTELIAGNLEIAKLASHNSGHFFAEITQTIAD